MSGVSFKELFTLTKYQEKHNEICNLNNNNWEIQLQWLHYNFSENGYIKACHNIQSNIWVNVFIANKNVISILKSS